jgi:hypothetical protein
MIIALIIKNRLRAVADGFFSEDLMHLQSPPSSQISIAGNSGSMRHQTVRLKSEGDAPGRTGLERLLHGRGFVLL